MIYPDKWVGDILTGIGGYIDEFSRENPWSWTVLILLVAYFQIKVPWAKKAVGVFLALRQGRFRDAFGLIGFGKKPESGDETKIPV